MIITEFLDLSAMLVPERTAITFEGKRYSYAQLKQRANRLADSLNRLGLKKGDRAAILEVNCNEYVEACFGVVRVGGIFVPLTSASGKTSWSTWSIRPSPKSFLLVAATPIWSAASVPSCLR